MRKLLSGVGGGVQAMGSSLPLQQITRCYSCSGDHTLRTTVIVSGDSLNQLGGSGCH